MSIDFKEKIAAKSDIELEVYLSNRNGYRPNVIQLVVDELKNRGRKFTDEELAEINKDIAAKKIELEKDESFSIQNRWRQNVVTDDLYPLFYSQRAIYIFSILFSTLFGSIMLAVNLNKHTKKGAWVVLSFGVLFFALTIYVANLFPKGSTFGLPFFFGMIGGYILNTFFWNKYIGKHTQYRGRPIWVPLIIGIIISALLIYLAIMSNNA